MLLTRRSFGAFACSSAVAGSLCGKNLVRKFVGELETEEAGPQALIRTPVIVPRDFVGMHAHRWPGGSSSPPTYPFGTARSHDFEGAAWYHIHVAPNRFEWDKLDQWVHVNSAADRTLIYTLYGTPEWLASRTDWKDLYGRPGGASAPQDLGVVAAFIKAVVTRYNGDGRRRIHLLETWNEPHFNNNPADYWWGNAEQLVAIGRTCSVAAKGIDPDVRVLTPGFVGDLTGGFTPSDTSLAAARGSSLYQYLTAHDGAGGKGSQWCDGIALHIYNSSLEGPDSGYSQSIRSRGDMLRRMNLTLPLFNTETGFLPPHSFRSQAPVEQGRSLRRLAVQQAALGVGMLCFYSHDDDLIGNPSLHPEVAQAITEVHAMIAGRTLLRVDGQTDGSVRVVTDERSFTW